VDIAAVVLEHDCSPFGATSVRKYPFTDEFIQLLVCLQEIEDEKDGGQP